MAQEVQASSNVPFSWARLGRGGVEEEARARAEALELARALTAQTIALERDAVIEDFPDRLRAIAETTWSGLPISGYGLHASLGAFLVAKVAVGWAPSGQVGLRHDPLDHQGMLEDLLEQRVDRALALTVLGDWRSVEPGFVAEPRGLEPSLIAGLAECSLTRRERALALSQVAYSARCLVRLAWTVNVLSTVRHVLPVLAPDTLGSDFAAGMVALALGIPARTLELIGDRPEGLAQRTIAELAQAMGSFEQRGPVSFQDEGAILLPPLGSVAASEPPPPPPPEQDDAEDGDVLEIVEERSTSVAGVTENRDLPSPARWPASAGSPVMIDEAAIVDWNERYRATLGLVARHNGLLGLRLTPPPRTVLPYRVPPDERFLGGPPVAALFPPVRGALRAIVLASDGRAPSDDAVKKAGDLTWVLLRAKALASIVRGDLEAAARAVIALPADASPEGEWAGDRLRRFGERRNVEVDPGEVRALAGRLVSDLALQLGRTIAGTVPSAPSNRVAGSDVEAS